MYKQEVSLYIIMAGTGCQCLRIMYVHMYKYIDRNRHTRPRGRVCYICITIICLLEEYGGCIHTYNIDTGRKWRITGDSTITGIDEQLTRGIGSACVIDLANLPLRPARC